MLLSPGAASMSNEDCPVENVSEPVFFFFGDGARLEGRAYFLRSFFSTFSILAFIGEPENVACPGPPSHRYDAGHVWRTIDRLFSTRRRRADWWWFPAL